MSNLKCAKCGSAYDGSVAMHRFPRPDKRGSFLKARIWAEYCYPLKDWSQSSAESLKKLYNQHKMLCGRHFDVSSYTSSDMKRLNMFAIPTDARHILVMLRQKFQEDESMKTPVRVSYILCYCSSYAYVEFTFKKKKFPGSLQNFHHYVWH